MLFVNTFYTSVNKCFSSFYCVVDFALCGVKDWAPSFVNDWYVGMCSATKLIWVLKA